MVGGPNDFHAASARVERYFPPERRYRKEFAVERLSPFKNAFGDGLWQCRFHRARRGSRDSGVIRFCLGRDGASSSTPWHAIGDRGSQRYRATSERTNGNRVTTLTRLLAGELLVQ